MGHINKIKSKCQLKFTDNVLDVPTYINCEIGKVEGYKVFSIKLTDVEAILTFKVSDVMQVIKED
ncbi:MAG: hypothetical protein RR335_11920 [Eubacterium sp.]